MPLLLPKNKHKPWRYVYETTPKMTRWDKLRARIRGWQQEQALDEADFKKDHLDAYEDDIDYEAYYDVTVPFY